MKLQVLQENLSSALSITSRFASSRAQLPVLANVLLSAKKNKLIVASTNLEISVSLSVGAKVQKNGELTVPARVITDLVSNLKTGPMTLHAEKEQLKISSQNFTSTLTGMNSSDFPEIPHEAGRGAANFPKGDFINALEHVLFAASIDETRPVLTGVLFLFDNNVLTLVATDGFRLSKKKLKLKSAKNLRISNNLIMPKNSLSELSRLSGTEDSIGFSYKEGEGQVVFSVNDAILASRIIEGDYPDFEKIIPAEAGYKIRLDKEEFLRAVKLASVFARDAANVVTLKVESQGLTVFAESSQSGRQEAKVDAKIEGTKKALKIAFNFRFLEDFLNVVKSEEVQIELSSASAPGVFTDTKDSDFLHLIMPVRIQD